MQKTFNGQTFEFDEKRVKECFYPENNTPFNGYSESIDAYNAGNIMKVIEIYIKNLTGHTSNEKQIQRIMNYLSIKIVQ